MAHEPKTPAQEISEFRARAIARYKAETAAKKALAAKEANQAGKVDPAMAQEEIVEPRATQELSGASTPDIEPVPVVALATARPLAPLTCASAPDATKHPKGTKAVESPVLDEVGSGPAQGALGERNKAEQERVRLEGHSEPVSGPSTATDRFKDYKPGRKSW